MLGWSWSTQPNADDLGEAALMHRLLGDFAAAGGGPMPATWSWPPVAGPSAPSGEPYTMVLALDGGFPGGGVRALRGFKAHQCGTKVLGELAGQEYWWCD